MEIEPKRAKATKDKNVFRYHNVPFIKRVLQNVLRQSEPKSPQTQKSKSKQQTNKKIQKQLSRPKSIPNEQVKVNDSKQEQTNSFESHLKPIPNEKENEIRNEYLNLNPTEHEKLIIINEKAYNDKWRKKAIEQGANGKYIRVFDRGNQAEVYDFQYQAMENGHLSDFVERIGLENLPPFYQLSSDLMPDKGALFSTEPQELVATVQI